MHWHCLPFLQCPLVANANDEDGDSSSRYDVIVMLREGHVRDGWCKGP